MPGIPGKPNVKPFSPAAREAMLPDAERMRWVAPGTANEVDEAEDEEDEGDPSAAAAGTTATEADGARVAASDPVDCGGDGGAIVPEEVLDTEADTVRPWLPPLDDADPSPNRLIRLAATLLVGTAGGEADADTDDALEPPLLLLLLSLL
jgi:hypothetical protein